jgi:hypothetical protein
MSGLPQSAMRRPDSVFEQMSGYRNARLFPTEPGFEK